MNDLALHAALAGLALVTASALPAVALAENDAVFTGNAVYTPQDPDGDGIYDALEAAVELDVRTPGVYALTACRLLEAGTTTVVANRRVYQSPQLTRGEITVPDTPGAYPALYSIPLLFSGEQIFRSGIDGPYDLQVVLLTPVTLATLTTDAFSYGQFGEDDAWVRGGTEQAVDDDGDLRYDYIEVTPEVVARVEGDYTITADLSNDQGFVVGVSSLLHFTPGTWTPALRLPGQKIRRAGRDGPYHVALGMSGQDSSPDGVVLETAAYNAADFAVLLETEGKIDNSGYDSNDNGLFESLRVSASIDVTSAGTYVVSGWLHVGVNVIQALQVVIATGGPQIVTFEFSGPQIYGKGMDGPYQLEIVVRNPSTITELDLVTLPEPTAAYAYTDFEPTDTPPAEIVLTGETSDYGVDLDGDDLYDELHVSVGLELAQAGYYHWAARLFAPNGTDLGFSADSGSLPQGAASIGFVFSDATISATGLDGPYDVTSLLIYCDPWPPGTPSLVVNDVAETHFYSADEFRCVGSRDCYSGPAGTLDVGACHAGTQTCMDGAWGACVDEVTPGAEVCTDGVDNDCNGATDAADSACAPGCTDVDGDGWGSPASTACPHPELDCDDQEAAVHPGAAEACNGRDDNCQDGIADEVCPVCSNGETRDCYSGPAGTLDVGACHAGTQTCMDGAWGTCVGEVSPVNEQCDNGVDDDCDGMVDAADSLDCEIPRTPPRAPGCEQGGGGGASPALLLLGLAICGLSVFRRRAAAGDSRHIQRRT